MNEFSIRQLAAAVTLQAVKDYFDQSATDKNRAAVLKDLRSSWMRDFTNGTSVNVAEQLEKRPNEVCERLRRNSNCVL